ncbi:hypothetical protein C8R43DRAFT_821736, partial [Mycena crocata]
LARHLHRLDKSPTPVCPCCGFIDETVAHYLLFCPTRDEARRQLQSVNRKASYLKHLLTNPELLPDLFIFIQRT